MLASASKEHYLTAFKQLCAHAPGPVPPWLSELRSTAIANFETLGFPTLKQEEWKYTSVEPLLSQAFVPANGEAKGVGADQIVRQSMVEPDAPRLVFINGVYAPEVSQSGDLPRGVVVEHLANSILRDDELVASKLGRYADFERQSFVALNTAFVRDGAVVSIASGCRFDRPIYLVFVSAAQARPVFSHPRTLILLGAGSEARVVESYLGVNGGAYFCNAVSELIGGADAVVEHYRLQQESDAGYHVGTLAANLERGCQLTAHGVSLRGAFVRNNVRVTLNGEGAECRLNGLYLADGTQHIDNFTEIEHAKPRARSLELYKGILGGSAHGVFHGRIVVDKEAQKSDARQTNKNLLLSGNAVVDSKPQLEIYADDVKCSHGSSIGQLDRDGLFYLRSRGLGLDEARSLLSFAFAREVIGHMKIEFLRRRLDEHLVERFRTQGARL
jgi:Fe-S cluster assembly protein SufD